MRAVFFAAVTDLRRRRGQTVALMTALLLSTLALYTAVALLLGLNEPFDAACRRLKTSPLQLFLDGDAHDLVAMRAWLLRHDAVGGVTPIVPIYRTSGDLLHNDQSLKRSLMLAEWQDFQDQDRLQVVSRQGDLARPGAGEVWLPQQMAAAHAIALGDVVALPMNGAPQRLTVTGTVVDPFFSTDNISPTRVWVAPGSLAMMLPLDDLNESFLGVAVTSPDAVTTVRAELEQAFGGALSGMVITQELARMAHGVFFRVMATALAMAALLALFVSLLIVAGAVGSAVFADYRQIGTFKALGYTPTMVTRIYMLRFVLPAFLALPPGLLLGAWASAALFDHLVGSLGVVDVAQPVAIPLVTAIGGVLLAVAATAGWSARRAGRVPAVTAIRLGAPAPRGGRFLAAPLVTGLPVTAFLGARSLSLNPVRACFAVAGIGVAVLVLVFSVNISATFARLSENRALWGMPAADLSVGLGGARFTVRPEVFATRLAADPRFSAVLASGSVRAEIQGVDGISGRSTFGRVFAGDPQALGLGMIEGRHPRAADEVVLAVNSAKKGGYALGDAVPLFIEGQHVQPTLVGIYQTGQNFGLGFRLDESAMEALLPIWRPRTFDIVTAPGVDSAAVKDEWTAFYGEAVTVSRGVELTEELAGLTGGIRATLVLLSLLLLAICAASIVNDTLLCLREQQQTLGILKAAGMAPVQLRQVLVWRALVVAVMGLVGVLPAALILLPLLLNNVAAGIGLVTFPLVFDPWGTAALVPLLLLFACACAWLPARAVSQLDPRRLMIA